MRARRNARYTVPYLIRELGAGASTIHYDNYQSFGARAVNHLAGRMQLTLVPPSIPFFRHSANEKVMQEIGDDAEAKSELEAAFAKIDRSVMSELEARQLGSASYEAFRHGIVAGNACLHTPPNDSIQVIPLTNYVCRRDGYGNPVEIIVHQEQTFGQLEFEIQVAVQEGNFGKQFRDEDTIHIYTWVRLIGDTWRVHQEIADVIIESTRGQYPKDSCPWLPIRWTRVSGEHYGRAKVDDDIGDLRALESIHKAVVEVALASAKTLFFVNPNGQTRRNTVASAKNLEVLYGRAEDVQILRVEKVTDLSVARGVAEQIERNMARSYLMQSSVQREGERVTATEIRYMATELETNLGGVYSLMASEFQRPLVKIITSQMMRQGKLPFLKKNLITAKVVAGVDALGRSHEAEQLMMVIASFAEIMNNPQLAEFIKPTKLLQRLADARNIDISGVVMSEEELAERYAQQQNQQLMERAAGPVAGQVAQAVTQGEPQ